MDVTLAGLRQNRLATKEESRRSVRLPSYFKWRNDMRREKPFINGGLWTSYDQLHGPMEVSQNASSTRIEGNEGGKVLHPPLWTWRPTEAFVFLVPKIFAEAAQDLLYQMRDKDILGKVRIEGWFERDQSDSQTMMTWWPMTVTVESDGIPLHEALI